MKNVSLFVVQLLIALVLQGTMGGSVYAQSLCIEPGSDQITGEKSGFRYELWNQNSQGIACMTLGKGALFSGRWSNVENYLARRGLSYNQTRRPNEIGTFYAKYNCVFRPDSGSKGNSYLAIYGWSVDPLVEYYIVEDWRNWIPSMAKDAIRKGSFYVDGSIYDIYQTTRVNQPSIVGTATFTQYFSIRRTVRNKGTIHITEHFQEWAKLGMELGKLHEVSFVVEGYKSSGTFRFADLNLYVK
jgi:endo-1,4-beta-xylanase